MSSDMSDDSGYGMSGDTRNRVGDAMRDAMRVAMARPPGAPVTPSARRMRWLAPAALATMLMASPALAQTEPVPAPTPAAASEQVQFIYMGQALIDGVAARPSVLLLDARARVEFERLRKLEFKVLGRLRETAFDPHLR